MQFCRYNKWGGTLLLLAVRIYQQKRTHALSQSNPLPTGHDIIVLGSSAGGLKTLQHLFRTIPADIPASFFVVNHIHPQSTPVLPALLQDVTPLRVHLASDNREFERGHVYVAPPDRHLLIGPGRMRVVHGPKENRHRPAIDPLFRSAAWAYGPRVVGVVLSGTLDDGTAGLWAVKSCGGVTVVQDPADALYAEMPANALRLINIDYSLAVAEIAALLADLAHRPITRTVPSEIENRIAAETEFARLNAGMQEMDAIGAISAFTCPACHGSLWELADGDILRYRCHVGHAFTAESLMSEQSEGVENALYEATRALAEKAALARRMAEQYQSRLPDMAQRYEVQAQELDDNAQLLMRLLGKGTG